MSDSPVLAAIRFEADGFDMAGQRLMGRQSAGHGFLRAAAHSAAVAGLPLSGYGPNAASHGSMAALVAKMDPSVATRWIRSDQLDLLTAAGVCYRGDPVLSPEAGLRLRAGLGSYSLCGITHTLSSPRLAAEIANYLVAPLASWDAVICTSRAAVGVIQSILAEQAAYLAWRFSRPVPPSPVQLPVIPLGVHADDFSVSPVQKAQARQRLLVADEEVVVLCAGRLSFSDKAHPWPLYQALQEAQARTGKPITLMMAGNFATPFMEQAFRSGAAQLCPDVRCMFVEGGLSDTYRDAWRAADIFVSMADSIQETFGLTPLEAMAAGLPVVVSDWNGYRETVREGIDGFRVPTWAPPPGAGGALARAYEGGVVTDGFYGWMATATTSVDMRVLADRLGELIDNEALRRTMGAAGQARVREQFDWRVVFSQYQALWADLNARRRAAMADGALAARVADAPRASCAGLDPFATFSHYPTSRMRVDTVVSLIPGASMARYVEFSSHGLFSEAGGDNEVVAALFAQLATGPVAIEEFAATQRQNIAPMIRRIGLLAKMGLVRLDAGGG